LQNVSPGLKGYPSNIKGDVVKTFRVPYSQLPQNARDVIDKERNYQDLVRSGRIKVKGDMPVQEQVLSEEWQSPDHADVERDPRKRWFNPTSGTNPKNWFDPQDIAPDYPNNAPPEMIDGYSSQSRLAPQQIDFREPFIKITKQDLAKNHRLKDSEIAEMMNTINKINEFLAAHPEELVYAQKRYPKNDPRLAELNWKQDQMLRASAEYIETQFPQNEKLFNRLQKSIKKNIELTDPLRFKSTPDPIIYSDVSEEVKPRKSAARFFKKPNSKRKPAYLKKKGKPNS